MKNFGHLNMRSNNPFIHNDKKISPNLISQNSEKLKQQINTLQTDVMLLKSVLTDYLITERLENGKIILDFSKAGTMN